MAVQFSLNGDALANATDTTFFRSATAPQSISVWINALWDGATQTTSLVGMYSSDNIPGGAGSALQIGSYSIDGQCVVWTWGGAPLVATTGIVIPSNTWVNITYTYDGTTHKLYYNGVLNNTSTVVQTAVNFNQVYMNGFANGGTSETGNFFVDTYDYYNRALSADEILTIYNAHGNRHGILYGALLRYEFDEDAVGAATSLVYNQTDYVHGVSDLLSATARTPRIAYSPGTAASNLRVPLGINS